MLRKIITNPTNIKIFKIYRWNPESKAKPYVSTYSVNINECGPLINFFIKQKFYEARRVQWF
jgi:succinate dehydrogenase/fumarate reductase-like Fe-S protein